MVAMLWCCLSPEFDALVRVDTSSLFLAGGEGGVGCLAGIAGCCWCSRAAAEVVICCCRMELLESPTGDGGGKGTEEKKGDGLSCCPFEVRLMALLLRFHLSLVAAGRSFGLRVEGWLFAGQTSGVEERGFEGRFRRIPA